MFRFLMIALLLFVLAACSGENDSVRASDVEKTLDNVAEELDKAAKDTAERLDDALK